MAVRKFTDEEKISLLLTDYQNSKVLFQGQQGSGKGASCTLYSLLVANILDLQMLSNSTIDYVNPVLERQGKQSFIPLVDKNQIAQNKNYIFILDEAQNYMDSRNFANNALINELLVELRKNGIIFHAITQFVDQLDLRARRLFNLIISCSKIYGRTPDENIFVWDLYRNPGYEKWEDIEEKCYFDTIYIPQSQMQIIFDSYNTLEKPKKF